MSPKLVPKTRNRPTLIVTNAKLVRWHIISGWPYSLPLKFFTLLTVSYAVLLALPIDAVIRVKRNINLQSRPSTLSLTTLVFRIYMLVVKKPGLSLEEFKSH